MTVKVHMPSVKAILVPGLFSKNWTLQPLRTVLEAAGVECTGAGFWVNGLVFGEEEKLLQVLERTGPAIVIGHSAGGLLAVRVARLRPDLVTQVVGLGSALVGTVSCPVSWHEARSLMGLLFPLHGPDELKRFLVPHALLPMWPSLQRWVVSRVVSLNGVTS